MKILTKTFRVNNFLISSKIFSFFFTRIFWTLYWKNFKNHICFTLINTNYYTFYWQEYIILLIENFSLQANLTSLIKRIITAFEDDCTYQLCISLLMVHANEFTPLKIVVTHTDQQFCEISLKSIVQLITADLTDRN